jgi:hypothetical protein
VAVFLSHQRILPSADDAEADAGGVPLAHEGHNVDGGGAPHAEVVAHHVLTAVGIYALLEGVALQGGAGAACIWRAGSEVEQDGLVWGGGGGEVSTEQVVVVVCVLDRAYQ